jgi:hypothetical protein
MLPAHSPFPCHWWGIGLEIVGLGDVRPDQATYGRFDFERLPRLPFELHGDFSWLYASPPHAHHIGQERAVENSRAFANLRTFAAGSGVVLPQSFLQFIGTPSLHERVRSNTDCFLDLCSELVPLPNVGGHVVRFLADSQACVFWYLYLTPDASDHAVVSTPAFYGTASEQWQDEVSEGSEIVFSAESIETFIGRFWLENEIWFSAYEKKPMTDAGKTYVESYRHGNGAAA